LSPPRRTGRGTRIKIRVASPWVAAPAAADTIAFVTFRPPLDLSFKDAADWKVADDPEPTVALKKAYLDKIASGVDWSPPTRGAADPLKDLTRLSIHVGSFIYSAVQKNLPAIEFKKFEETLVPNGKAGSIRASVTSNASPGFEAREPKCGAKRARARLSQN